jgi:hypothetical protein
MNECSCYQDSRTKMLAKEEYGRWDLHPFDLLGDDRKAASTDTGKEDNEDSRYVEWKVVFPFLCRASALWLCVRHFDDIKARIKTEQESILTGPAWSPTKKASSAGDEGERKEKRDKKKTLPERPKEWKEERNRETTIINQSSLLAQQAGRSALSIL